MYKLLNIIRKSEFMDSNLLQCDTLVAALLLVIAGYRPSIGLLAKMHNKKHTTFIAPYVWGSFCSIVDSEVI